MHAAPHARLLHRQLQQPTCADMALTASLTPNDTHLIIARSNTLDIYQLKTPATRGAHPSSWEFQDRGTNGSNNLSSSYLALVLRVPLHGTIYQLDKARLGGATTDTLVLGFREACVSFLHFSLEEHDLVTVSMHYFDAKKEAWAPRTLSLYAPLVRVDPDNRCSAVVVFQSQLAVLPFMHAHGKQAKPRRVRTEDNYTLVHSPHIGDEHLIPLEPLGVGRVQDMCFLHGHTEPTLLILHEKEPTWAARAPVRSNTHALLALSLSITSSGVVTGHTVIGGVEDISLRAGSVVAAPLPIGGAMVVCTNLLLHYNNNAIEFGVSLNGYGDQEVEHQVHIQRSNPQTTLTLDGCRLAFFDPKRLLVVCSDGDMYLAALDTPPFGGRLRSIKFTKLAAGVQPSCMTMLDSSHLFLGSNHADSVLLFVELVLSSSSPSKSKSKAVTDNNGEVDDLELELFGGALEEVKPEEPADDPDGDSEMAAADEPKLPSPTKPSAQQLLQMADNKQLTLVEKDRLRSLAPLSHFDVWSSPKELAALGEAVADDRRTFIEMVACSGRAKHGSMTITTQGVMAEVKTGVDFNVLIRGCWSVRVRSGAPLRKGDDAMDVSDDEDGGGDGEMPTPRRIGEAKKRKTNNGAASSSASASASSSSSSPEYDAFLIFSHARGTFVFTSISAEGESTDLSPLKESDFYQEGPTLGTGNLFSGRRIVQIFDRGVRLLDGVVSMDEQIWGTGVNVRACEIVDPYVLLLMKDGSLRLLTATETPEKGMHLVTSIPTLDFAAQQGGVRCMYLFKDPGTTSMFRERVVSQTDAASLSRLEALSAAASSSAAAADADGDADMGGDKEDDDEFEAFLFGDDEEEEAKPAVKVEPTAQKRSHEEAAAPSQRAGPTSRYVCALARFDGTLELYSVPEFTLLFSMPNCSTGLALLKNNVGLPEEEQVRRDDEGGLLVITDICFELVGSVFSRPYLMMFLSNDDLLIYEAFEAPASALPAATPVSLRFRRVHHTLITRPLGFVNAKTLGKAIRTAEKPKGAAAAAAAAAGDSAPASTKVRRLWKGGPRFSPFRNICGRSGVLIGGYRPACAFGDRDGLHLHEVVIEDESSAAGISSATPFHMQSSPHAFIYFDLNGRLNLAEFPPPTRVFLGESMPFRKVHLGRTPHFVSRHAKSQTYGVVVSTPLEAEEQDLDVPNAPTVYQPEFEVLIYDPRTWEVRQRFNDFKENEAVLCFTYVELGGKNVLVLGTSNYEDETRLTRGRVIMLELYWTQQGAEAEAEADGWTLKMNMFEEDLTSPVTRLAQCGKLLAVASGQRMLLYEWIVDRESGGQLKGRAFHDTQFFVTSLSCVKDYIMFSDITQSVTLLHWDAPTRQLRFLARDVDETRSMTAEFLVDGPHMCMLVADEHRNVQGLYFEPHVSAGNAMLAKRLVRHNDMHLGVLISHFRQLRLHEVQPTHPLVLSDPDFQQTWEGAKRGPLRTVCIGSTAEGAYTSLQPLEPSVYRRLYSLHTQMTFELPHHAGLNPRAYRAFTVPDEGGKLQRQRNIVDGEFVMRYLSLDIYTQASLAGRIGTTPEQVVENLLEVQLSSLLF